MSVESDPQGILNPGAIDDITVDEHLVTLHVRQTCAWDGSDHLLLLVQEKLFNYLTFVADGELAERYPSHRSRWRVVMECTSEPDGRTHELLQHAAGQFQSLGGALELTIKRPSPPDP